MNAKDKRIRKTMKEFKKKGWVAFHIDRRNKEDSSYYGYIGEKYRGAR